MIWKPRPGRQSLPILMMLFVQMLQAQNLPIIEKTSKWKIPDVEQPTLHLAPWDYYKPTVIWLNSRDTVSEST